MNSFDGLLNYRGGEDWHAMSLISLVCVFFCLEPCGDACPMGASVCLLQVSGDLCCHLLAGRNMKRRLTVTGLSLILVGIALGGDSVLGQQRGQQRGQQNRSSSGVEVWDYLQDKYDANGDDQLTEAEYSRGAEKFQRLDVNRDGVISAKDWSGGNSRKSFSRERQKRSLNSSNLAPPVKGDVAPGFNLTYVNEPSKTVELASFRGSRPVALIFGSCS